MRYSVKAAARATGVSESSLRTWERRYGIPQPGRSATGRRQYDESDLAVIRRMASLVAVGVPASEAAQVARVEGAAPEKASESERSEDPLVRRITQAASVYDEAAVVSAIRDSYVRGWSAALDEVLFPALRKIGEHWGEGTIVSANEHFATEVIRREVSTAISSLPVDRDKNGAGVLLACPEGERHDLGLLALDLLLLEKGIGTIYLGAEVPQGDLVRAVSDLAPRAVCLSATLPTSLTSMRRSMRALISARSNARLYAGGPAVTAAGESADIPAVMLPASLGDAVEVLTRGGS
jgi:methanogenic corrinoid protein MtbC1